MLLLLRVLSSEQLKTDFIVDYSELFFLRALKQMVLVHGLSINIATTSEWLGSHFFNKKPIQACTWNSTVRLTCHSRNNRRIEMSMSLAAESIYVMTSEAPYNAKISMYFLFYIIPFLPFCAYIQVKFQVILTSGSFL